MPRIDEVSDAQLVTSIARYSEVALAEAYRRHGGAVFGLAKRVLQNPTDAEDVTQEVFLRLWNQPDRFDPGRVGPVRLLGCGAAESDDGGTHGCNGTHWRRLPSTRRLPGACSCRRWQLPLFSGCTGLYWCGAEGAGEE